jgi:chemotaxis protein histidine kinase CheA
MQDWQSQFESMRASFLARAGERLDRIYALLNRLYCTPTDKDVLAEVRQHFHWLCGVGGTYKLPEVSELGWEGEELCDRLVDGDESPSATDISRLHNLLASVKEHFRTVGVA